jgi:hypothetical protein
VPWWVQFPNKGTADMAAAAASDGPAPSSMACVRRSLVVTNHQWASCVRTARAIRPVPIITAISPAGDVISDLHRSVSKLVGDAEGMQLIRNCSTNHRRPCGVLKKNPAEGYLPTREYRSHETESRTQSQHCAASCTRDARWITRREVGSLVMSSGTVRRAVAVTPCSSLLRRPHGQFLRTPDLEGRHLQAQRVGFCGVRSDVWWG